MPPSYLGSFVTNARSRSPTAHDTGTIERDDVSPPQPLDRLVIL